MDRPVAVGSCLDRRIKGLIAEAASNAQQGSRLVEEADGTIEQLAASVEELGYIAVASREQSSSVDGINKALVRMQDVTHRNAGLVNECARHSEAFSSESARLFELVGRFRLDTRQPARALKMAKGKAEGPRPVHLLPG